MQYSIYKKQSPWDTDTLGESTYSLSNAMYNTLADRHYFFE